MNRLVIVGILMISTAPLFAQGAKPDAAKLKADAQKVVSIITGDTAKSQTYCQVLALSDELDQVDQRPQESRGPVAEGRRFAKKLGPEYLALLENLEDVDPDSKDGQEIVSTFDKLDKSCPH